ncbi:glycosyltransferase [Pseudoroseicyclus aestuarii]|nr:glycosyltransferase family A protein [Pseudoroseicyclus aestuarii]
MLTVLAGLCCALAAFFALMAALNLLVFRAPPPAAPGAGPRVTVLIPARDEAATIGAAIDAVLASRGVVLRVLVLDDGSTDGTAGIVRRRAEADPRLRLISGSGLPKGWNGKQHACWQLAQAAEDPLLVFVDADVRLAPDALARMAAGLEARDLDLLSGFPRQSTGSLAEDLIVPQILVLLLGYLPLPIARRRGDIGLAAGCGQLMAVRREAYLRSGGHRAFAASMHDGLQLPRLLRRHGYRTDICDAAPLAVCRMYDGWAQVWSGFSKNATEGMATPVALPIWTLLLGGGHVLPCLLAPLAWAAGAGSALSLSLIAVALVLAARAGIALRGRQNLRSVLLHPLGVALSLAIQWRALMTARAGRQVQWRGRHYDAG